MKAFVLLRDGCRFYYSAGMPRAMTQKEEPMYRKVDTNLNFVSREKETEKFWEDNQICEKSMKEREGSPMYTFYDGPPVSYTHLGQRHSDCAGTGARSFGAECEDRAG